MIPTFTTSMYISLGIFLVMTIAFGFSWAIVITSIISPVYYFKEPVDILRKYVAISFITLFTLLFSVTAAAGAAIGTVVYILTEHLWLSPITKLKEILSD